MGGICSCLFWPGLPTMLTALCMQARLMKGEKLWTSASGARQPQVIFAPSSPCMRAVRHFLYTVCFLLVVRA